MVFTNINNIYTNVIFPFPFVRLSYLPSQRDGCPLVGHSSTFTKLLSSLIAKVENPVRQPSYFLGCSVSKISVALPTLCVRNWKFQKKPRFLWNCGNKTTKNLFLLVGYLRYSTLKVTSDCLIVKNMFNVTRSVTQKTSFPNALRLSAPYRAPVSTGRAARETSLRQPPRNTKCWQRLKSSIGAP